MSYIVVFITTSSFEEAEKISNYLVENKLAACVNIIKNVKSIFFWQGNKEDAEECLLIVKTKKDLFKNLAKEVKKFHNYTIPEIVALPIIDGNEDYLNWIEETVR